MKAAVRNSLKNIALLLIASLLSLIAMEFAYRFVSGVSLAELKSFRDRDALRKVIGTVAYDPDLGWAFLSNEQIRISIPGGYYAGRPEPWSYNITIGELGIRSNSSERAAIRKGGILAVGDSFTAGSEIDDHGAWPAQLEKIINRPVINGAVGGYGSDQIVMRAESMLPLVVPEVLVVGMLDQDILRVGYSSFGAPKPYYTMEGGKLTLHNSPVPLLNLSEHGVGWTKRVAAHSFVIDQVMSRLFPNTWLAAPKQVFTQTTVDIVDVTCELLKRLKLKTDDLKIRTLLLMQYGGSHINAAEGPSELGMQVGHCANDMGFQIIDEFDSLKAIARANPDEFRTYFMMHSGAFGHMSERGNRHIAELVSSSLAAAPLDRRAKDYVSSAFIPGDRQNLLPNSEAINEYVEPSPTVSIERVGGLSTEPKEYRLVAKDGSGERYLVTKSLDLPAGPYTLALDVRVNRGGGFRLKLLDVEGNGVVGDFDLTNMKAQATPLRVAQGARAGISDVGDGFYRVSLGANLPGKDTKIFFELNGASDGADSSGVPESYHIRAVQLEYGQSATAYRASIRSSKPNIVGDGHNLVARVGPWEKFLVGTSTASFASAEDENSYRVSASGGSGEHYLVSQVVELEPGPHVLSLEVRPEASSHIRVQLLNANSDGAIADYDLVKRRSTAMTVGKGHEAFSDIKRLEEGWYRLQLVTEFPGGSTRMLLGLTDARGSTGFLPQGERFRVRSVAIERVR